MAKNDFKNVPKRAKEGEITCDHPGCSFAIVPDSIHCAIHHRVTTDLYRLERAEVVNRLHEIRSHPDSRHLEIELALMRKMLETVLNQCQESTDLIRNSGTIGSLIDKIQGLLASNVKIGQITGTLMTLEEVADIAKALVGIVAEYLDPDEIAEVVDQFEEVLYESR